MTNSMAFSYGFGSKHRNIKIIERAMYEVQPLNKQKNPKNRGRICTAMRFRKYYSPCGEHETIRVRVKWQDNERYGYVDPTDLIGLNQG